QVRQKKADSCYAARDRPFGQQDTRTEVSRLLAQGRRRNQCTSLGESNESFGFCQEDLPQLQDHPPQGRGARDLHRPASQAAPGLSVGIRGLTWHVLLASTSRRTSTRKSA